MSLFYRRRGCCCCYGGAVVFNARVFVFCARAVKCTKGGGKMDSSSVFCEATSDYEEEERSAIQGELIRKLMRILIRRRPD